MLTDSMTVTPTTQVLCVYKTGGPYSPAYVQRLYDAVHKNTNNPIDFVCLTDDEDFILSDFCETIELKHGWPGWWSKIELFRPDLPHVPSVYFDLDTVIKGDLDPLLFKAHLHAFIALRGFNHRLRKPGSMNFASGIMAGSFWEYSPVYDKFLEDPEKFMTTKQENWMHGDQGFIASVIGVDNVPRLQEFLPDNYIVGKRIIKEMRRIPAEAKVIAWSGSPRLHELLIEEKSINKELHTLWAGANE